MDDGEQSNYHIIKNIILNNETTKPRKCDEIDRELRRMQKYVKLKWKYIYCGRHFNQGLRFSIVLAANMF